MILTDLFSAGDAQPLPAEPGGRRALARFRFRVLLHNLLTVAALTGRKPATNTPNPTPLDQITLIYPTPSYHSITPHHFSVNPIALHLISSHGVPSWPILPRSVPLYTPSLSIPTHLTSSHLVQTHPTTSHPTKPPHLFQTPPTPPHPTLHCTALHLARRTPVVSV